MLTPEKIKKHPQIQEFIRQTEFSLHALDYNEHGFRHAKLVSKRAAEIARAIGLNKREEELAAIVGYCHDMGNFIGRREHHYWGAMLFHQIFQNNFSPKEISLIIQAIVNHDKYTMKLVNPISAVVVLADKSDVHRSRVTVKSLEKIKSDIHDRVNYAVTRSVYDIDKKGKRLILVLKIDTGFCPIIEYFEIFTDRMSYCRKAAEFLGYKFSLMINNFKLL